MPKPLKPGDAGSLPPHGEEGLPEEERSVEERVSEMDWDPDFLSTWFYAVALICVGLPWVSVTSS